MQYTIMRHWNSFFDSVPQGNFEVVVHPSFVGLTVDFIIDVLLTENRLSWCRVDVLASGMLCYGFLAE